MKSDVIERPYPKSVEEWEALIAEAPGDDRPPDPAAVRAALAERRRTRGAQKAPTKEQVAIRLSPDVLAYFRATGNGWHTRMDAALNEWIASHPRVG